MNIKQAIFAVLVAFFILATSSSSVAVDTTDIDKVRNNKVLDDQDLKIIDDFLAQAVQELVRTRDFTSIAKVRTVILSRHKSTQGQYIQQFSESAHKHISAGFEQAQTLNPQERKTKVIINLLILIDGLEDLRLANLALGMLKNDSKVVRYWAVHCLTNPAIIEQLNSGTTSNVKVATIIAEQFKQLVESSSPEIIALMTKFASDVNIPQAEELLLQIADMRIKKYADWTVEYELLDSTILKSLNNKISLPSEGPGGSTPTTSSGKLAAAQHFGQLYSYAIQRYVIGSEILSDIQKQHLASVLVEIEDKCLGRLIGKQQTTIKRAIERNMVTALIAEHNRLLGDETTPGQLPLKLGFDFGTTTDGSKRTAPIPLPSPPQKSTVEN